MLTNFELEYLHHDSDVIDKPVENFFIARVHDTNNDSLYNHGNTFVDVDVEYAITKKTVMKLHDIPNKCLPDMVYCDVWDMAMVCRNYKTTGDWFNSWGGAGYVEIKRISLESFKTLWEANNPTIPYDSNPDIMLLGFSTHKHVLEQF